MSIYWRESIYAMILYWRFDLNLNILRDAAGLKMLIAIYVARTESIWKEPAHLRWLEANVREALALHKANDSSRSLADEWTHMWVSYDVYL